jgi:hypothetical protein
MPRFRLFRTAADNHWRVRDALDAALGARLGALVASEPVVEDFEAHPPAIDAYRTALEESAPIQREYRGPAFRFPDPLPDLAGDAIVVTPARFDLLGEHFGWAIEEWDDIQPVTVTIEDGVAVSICHSPALSDRAAEAGVFTAEVARGRGHATAVVSLWARLVRDTGRLPMYSTSWDNPASRRVAAKLGVQLYGEDFHLE